MKDKINNTGLQENIKSLLWGENLLLTAHFFILSIYFFFYYVDVLSSFFKLRNNSSLSHKKYA